MSIYLIPNGPTALGAQVVPVTTGIAIKTMLQFRPSATKAAKLIGYGVSFKGFAAAEPIRVDVVALSHAATVAAHVAAGLQKYDADALQDGDPTTNLIRVGTADTGFTATAEGTTPTGSRIADMQQIAPTNQNLIFIPLGNEFQIKVDEYLRLRVLAPVAVDMYCYFLIRI